MLIFPAIDISGGNVVRLHKGDYSRMTVYGKDPLAVAAAFAKAGATHMHVVDLDGAKSGGTPNIDLIMNLRRETGLFIETGGGIRSMEVIERYLNAGIDRVILGTAAIENEALIRKAAKAFGGKIAVGADLKDGFVAVRGWTERTAVTAEEFIGKLSGIGVETVVCTDISRDGAMRGTNRELYRHLSGITGMKIIASGGISNMDDVRALASMDLYGAIIGKAYYEGAIDIGEAVREARK